MNSCSSNNCTTLNMEKKYDNSSCETIYLFDSMQTQIIHSMNDTVIGSFSYDEEFAKCIDKKIYQLTGLHPRYDMRYLHFIQSYSNISILQQDMIIWKEILDCQ